MMLVDAKYFLFDVIESEFVDKYFPVEISLGEYVIYETSLNNYIIYSNECVDFFYIYEI